MTCKNCFTVAISGAEYCHKCGIKVETAALLPWAETSPNQGDYRISFHPVEFASISMDRAREIAHDARYSEDFELKALSVELVRYTAESGKYPYICACDYPTVSETKLARCGNCGDTDWMLRD